MGFWLEPGRCHPLGRRLQDWRDRPVAREGIGQGLSAVSTNARCAQNGGGGEGSPGAGGIQGGAALNFFSEI